MHFKLVCLNNRAETCSHHEYLCSLIPSSGYCNTDSQIFEAWVEQDLLPKLPPKSVLVIDNASFHKKENIEEILDRDGHKLLFLPPYSPNYNHIEKKWAHSKSKRRKLQCSIDDLYKYNIT